MYKDISRTTKHYYILSIALLLCGYGFYILIRGFDPLFGQWRDTSIDLALPSLLNNNLASFIHVLAISFLSYALLGARQKHKIIIALFWSLSNLFLELLQRPLDNGIKLIPGTFDPLDIVAIVIASIVFLILSTRIDARHTQKKIVPPQHNLATKTGLAFVGLFGMFSILASYTEYEKYEPVYMSYEELRGPLKIETNRGLLMSGKIYLYQNLLLVSEPNKGIHIYDNTNPSAPVQKVFLNIPGNLDIAIRNGYLYADSFIDLLVIDINDLNNIVATQRIEWAFPYNPYQAIEEEKRDFFNYDKNAGVIIDVREKYEPGGGNILDVLYDIK